MKNFDYYVALITATATEEAGVMHMYKDWKPLNLEGDSQKYYETAVERKGKRLKLVAARQDEMGMTAAGVLTMKMITLFKPRFVFDEEKSDQYQRFTAFTSSQFAKYLIEN